MTPAQAKQMIETELPHPRCSKALLTKGIVNLFSNKTQKFLKNNLVVEEDGSIVARGCGSGSSTEEGEMVEVFREGGMDITRAGPFEEVKELRGRELLDSLDDTRVTVLNSSDK